jgi:hypothetical protein
MMHLALPAIDPDQLLKDAAENASDLTLRTKYLAHRPHFSQAVVDFGLASEAKNWCTMPRVPRGNSKGIIFGTVTKGELTKLYSKYMVGSGGPARQAYDDILVTASGTCPFCGGIGHAKTLDHYLPKANFPQFAICPQNLVPCCRDCNSEKLSSFPTDVNQQGIHPYADGHHFFDERWVFATALATNPVGIRFTANPPAEWPAQDKLRAEAHFKSYDLAARYSIEVGREISWLIDLRRTTLNNNNTPVQFQNFLIDISNSNSLPLNGWKRTMYAALAETDWFYTDPF